MSGNGAEASSQVTPLLDFLDRFGAGTAVRGYVEAFENAVAALGLGGPCAAYSIGFGTERRCSFLFNRMPEPLRSLFVGEIDVHGNAIVGASMSRHEPFTYLELIGAMTESAELGDVAKVALECGLIDGVVFPVHGPFGYLGMVSLVSPSEVRLRRAIIGVLDQAARVVFDIARNAARLDSVARTANLTLRERETMSLVAMGRTDEQIARTLGVAPSTVRHHADNAREKLGAASRAEAVALLSASGSL